MPATIFIILNRNERKSRDDLYFLNLGARLVLLFAFVDRIVTPSNTMHRYLHQTHTWNGNGFWSKLQLSSVACCSIYSSFTWHRKKNSSRVKFSIDGMSFLGCIAWLAFLLPILISSAVIRHTWSSYFCNMRWTRTQIYMAQIAIVVKKSSSCNYALGLVYVLWYIQKPHNFDQFSFWKTKDLYLAHGM